MLWYGSWKRPQSELKNKMDKKPLKLAYKILTYPCKSKMNAAFKCEKMISNVSRRLKLSTMDHREKNKNVLVEDKFGSEALFEDGDIRSQNEHITETQRRLRLVIRTKHHGKLYF